MIWFEKNIPMKSTKTRNKIVTKIIRNHVTQFSYHTWYWKLPSKNFKCSIQFNIILHVIRISFICHLHVLVCDSYVKCSLILFYIWIVCYSRVLVCNSYGIRMSLVCTCMSSVCRSYVTRMSLVCTRMPYVCHSHILICHSYVTRMSLVCSFTMNRLRLGWREIISATFNIFHTNINVKFTFQGL